MSCCPPAPEIVEGDSADGSFVTQDTQILPGESVECYMKRAENPTGLKDDLTDYVPDKIHNTSIPVGPNADINVTFKLTPDSTRTPTSWTVSGTLPTGVTLVGDTLSGTVDPVDHGKSFSLLITAVDGGGTIDSRTFTFSPVPVSKDGSIQFVNPLPGGRVTSQFNPNRKHPVRGTISPHKGVDMSSPGATLGDIVAAADGEVIFKGFQGGGAGNYIKINHRSANGELLCQTVYMHLDTIYVTEGQKVAAGQKIGKEGNTGIGTAAHLHFECRLLKGGQQTWIDPLPLIRGVTDVAQKTDGLNQGIDFQPQQGGAHLSSQDAAARAGGCEAFGPSYPPDPEAPTPAPLPPVGSPFELAWFFTMKYEVGPHWQTTAQFSPGDADLDAGLKDTTFQRKQVGYKNYAGFPGGETKFGIAQGPNPNIAVGTIDYATAKQVGYDNYWRRGSNSPSSYETTKPKTSIMLFDMTYLHGAGNLRGSILPKADISSLDDAASCVALQQAQEAFINEIVRRNPSLERYKNGWLNRSRALLAYVQPLP